MCEAGVNTSVNIDSTRSNKAVPPDNGFVVIAYLNVTQMHHQVCDRYHNVALMQRNYARRGELSRIDGSHLIWYASVVTAAIYYWQIRSVVSVMGH